MSGPQKGAIERVRAGRRTAAVTGFALGSALAMVAPAAARADPGTSSSSAPRAMTDLDDARACEPLDGGGIAVATGGGLAIVGKDDRVRALTSLDGLPDTRVHALARAAGRDALWVGTEAGAALVALEGGAPRVVRTAGSEPVQAIHVAADGEIYLATRGEGVLRLETPEAAPQPVASAMRAVRATAIAERDGVVYVAYADGPLARLDPRDGVLRAMPGSPAHGQSLANIGGVLVLGDLQGLYRVDPDGFAPIASVDARGLAASGETLLAATYGAGLEKGDVRGALHEEPGVPRLARGVGVRGAARCVATAGGVFVDPGGGGFSRVPLGGPPSNDVTALVVSPSGRVAVGTFEDGAVLRDREAFRPVPGIEPDETIEGMAWQDERLWLATSRGLVRVSPDGAVRRFTASDGLASSFVRAVHPLSDGRVLVGTDDGPAILDHERVVPIGAPGPMHAGARGLASPRRATYAVGASTDGTLFLGTTAGLYYGTMERGFQRASLATGELEDDWVTAIAAEGRDVYVGTYAKGITRLRFVSGAPRPTATHLGGGHINDDGLTIAKGRLWASTMDGLLVRDLAAAGDVSSWELQARASTGRDVTATRFAGDAMWVASRRGIAVGGSR